MRGPIEEALRRAKPAIVDREDSRKSLLRQIFGHVWRGDESRQIAAQAALMLQKEAMKPAGFPSPHSCFAFSDAWARMLIQKPGGCKPLYWPTRRAISARSASIAMR